MILFGAALIAISVLVDLPGALRFFLGLAGVVVVLPGFLLALGVTRLRIGASPDGGLEASADIPTGYTRTMKVSPSLTQGSSPPKDGVMPPKDGFMPPKEGAMPSKQDGATSLE
jgi:hypothetical protein